MDYDNKYLKQCREEIELKLGWPPSGQWRDFEFTELGDQIYVVTSVQLSTTTLKRIFGKVKYGSLPSTSTLNALACYLGYDNWMAYKGREVSSPPKSPRRFVLNKKTMVTMMALVTLVAILGFVFLSSSSSSSAIPVKDIIFSSKPLAKGLPNSVVFTVDLKNIKSDDLLIQQSWDSTKTVKLKPGQTTATGIYYLPGYFRAKLLVDKKMIKEHDLFIRSEGWMATIDNNPDPPTYLKPGELILDRNLSVSPQLLEKIKKIERPTTLTYHLVQPFEGLKSDDFILNTALQNVWSEGPAVCKTVKLFILCSRGAFIIPFTIPGCASDINLKLNDRTWEGKSNDLSAFSTDPAQRMQIRLEAKNRVFSIYLNGKLVSQQHYALDAGDIVGLRFSFLGAGEIDYVRLSSSNGKSFYDEQFAK